MEIVIRLIIRNFIAFVLLSHPCFPITQPPHTCNGFCAVILQCTVCSEKLAMCLDWCAGGKKERKINFIQSVVGTALSDTFPQVFVCVAVVNPVFMCSCLRGCIDVTLDPLLLPNPSTSLGRWLPVSLNPGELIRISGEERTPDRVRTNCTAELHSDAFRSVFTSVCFGCMSVDLSGWQMRDWPAQAFDILAEHPQTHTCTDNAYVDTYGSSMRTQEYVRWHFKYPFCQIYGQTLKVCIYTFLLPSGDLLQQKHKTCGDQEPTW